MVFENEFSLFYPLIQLADILPHSKAWVPGLFRQRPHLVEIGIVERPQAGNSAGRLFSKKNKEAAGRRCLFPSPVRRLRIQDAVLDSFRGVVFSQGFKTNGAPGTRQDHGGVLAVKPESIALFFHHPQELLPCEGSGNRFFDIFLDGCFPCLGTVLLGQPQGIRTGYPFRFLCMDDGKAVLYAQFVRNLPHPSYIGFFIAAVLFPVFHGDRVPHNMVVDAFGVEMGTDHRLKFPAEQPVRKFHSDLMRQFRGDFSGSKTLHQMESLHAFFLMPYLFDLTHILKGRVYGTADG